MLIQHANKGSWDHQVLIALRYCAAANARVRFPVDGRPYSLQVGQVYEIKVHSVINKGGRDRIHCIFDYMLLDREPGASRELPA